MLYIPNIRENKSEIIELLKIKNFDGITIIDELLVKDDSRKETQKELDELLSKSNQLSKQIGEFYKSGDVEKANKLTRYFTEEYTIMYILAILIYIEIRKII